MPDDTAVYLHVKIQLVRGKYTLFAKTMAEMAPVLEENGWRLIGAFTPAIGRLGAVYHVWRVPSPDGVLSASGRRAWPSGRSPLARRLRRVDRGRGAGTGAADHLLPRAVTGHRPTTA